ncbi:MAG: deoxyribodipyrimidine photo-lyase [Chromatiales bacterium]|nr:deoxyribodipyrimidine photo-lyase [Chromatiales bacterium]
MTAPAIWWLRNDFRLTDNSALHAAAATGAPVLAVFVLPGGEADDQAGGAASRWWLHHSLAALSDRLAKWSVPLLLRRGPAADVLADIARDTGTATVFAARRYEPWARRQQRAVRARLAEEAPLQLYGGRLMFEPAALRNRSDQPFQVFTPFWKACLAAGDPGPVRESLPDLRGFSGRPGSERLEDWLLLPRQPDWAGGLREHWQPGETGALERWQEFLAEGLDGYHLNRDRPDLAGTSRLSPHLHFGEIGIRWLWAAVCAAERDGLCSAAAADCFRRELGWREFSAHLLYHWPELTTQPLRREFMEFPWREDADALAAWQRGATGYPLVDAGMRELWHTGWMHNRVRMVAASFLVKHLLLHWQHGEAWFRDTLVDADLANNVAGWQWVAGSGADAAPFFRIFNPVLQGQKFDPDGHYVRRWVPELARLPDRWLQEPWSAPAEVLAAAGVLLGRDYPAPLVEHPAARERALAAFETLRR